MPRTILKRPTVEGLTRVLKDFDIFLAAEIELMFIKSLKLIKIQETLSDKNQWNKFCLVSLLKK